MPRSSPLLCSATAAALSWVPSAAAVSCAGRGYFSCKAAAQDCVWSTQQMCASHLSHKLANMNQTELDVLYSLAPAGAIPHGKGYGTALFTPDMPATNLGLAGIAQFVWQGKFFDRDAGTLMNQVLGMQAIKASVYHAESWFDGKKSVILDYSQDAPGAFKMIRDEIRQIAPREYLGRVYLFLPGQPFVINFALEFVEEQVPESSDDAPADSASNAAKQQDQEHSSGVPRPAAGGFAAVCSAAAALCAGGAMFIVGRKRGHAAGDSDHADTVSLDAVPSKQLALTQHAADV